MLNDIVAKKAALEDNWTVGIIWADLNGFGNKMSSFMGVCKPQGDSDSK